MQIASDVSIEEEREGFGELDSSGWDGLGGVTGGVNGYTTDR